MAVEIYIAIVRGNEIVAPGYSMGLDDTFDALRGAGWSEMVDLDVLKGEASAGERDMFVYRGSGTNADA